MFEWDEQKKAENFIKHGLSFEDAENVFGGPCLTFEDSRFDYGEVRYLTFGLLQRRVVVMPIQKEGATHE